MDKKIFNFLLLTCTFGANIFGINIGIAQLTIFRVLLLVELLLVIAKKNGKIEIKIKSDNCYSILFMIGWLLYACITIIWVEDTRSWLKYTFLLFNSVAITYVSSSVISNMEDILDAFKWFQRGILLQVIIGIYQMITRDYSLANIDANSLSYYTSLQHSIPYGTYSNLNDFATLMFIGFFVSLICFSSAKKVINKVAYLLESIACAVLIFSSYSRATLIGLLLGGTTVIFLTGRKKISLFIFSGGIIAISFFSKITALLSDRLTFNIASGSDYVRINLLKNGLLLLKESFGMGVGSGQISSWLTHSDMLPTGGTIVMHNFWMEILASYGIIIFVLYIIFYLKLLRKFINSEKTVSIFSGNKLIFRALIGLMLGYIIACNSSSSLFTEESIWTFWAICIAFQGVENKSHEF